MVYVLSFEIVFHRFVMSLRVHFKRVLSVSSFLLISSFLAL